MLNRPHSFDDIVGHPKITSFFIEHIKNGTLPQQILLSGEEGLGKTSFADVIAVSLVYGLEDSKEKSEAIRDVIDGNKSNNNIKKYKMSVEGGKESAKEVLLEFNTDLTSSGIKVIIMDECHNLSEAAQDVFLQDTEYLPKGLYLFMITTETQKLKPTLLSRFFPITLRPLKQSDMLTILHSEVYRRNLNIQGGDATLTVIAEWAGNKPRAAIKILDGFADGTSVSESTIKELVGYLEIDDVLPLVESLTQSMTSGLMQIQEMVLSDTILDILIEFLKIKDGHMSYRIRMPELKRVNAALLSVPIDNLLRFVYTLSGYPKITRAALIHSYLASHVSSEMLESYNPKEVLQIEQVQKAQVPVDIPSESTALPTSFADLLRSSNIVEE